MQKLVRFARDGAVMIVIVFVLFEIVLRLIPGLIPPILLVFFNESLRSSVASRLELPVEDDQVKIVRDDGGPPLSIYHPYAEVVNHFDDVGTEDITVDEQGFCNTDDMAYQRETIDVITIGDSFTFCTSVAPESSWSAQLQEQTGVSFYNLGMPGRGLYEYLQLFKTYGVVKQPKTVVMAVYEGNDLRDALRYHNYKAGIGLSLKKDLSDCGAGRVCKVYMHLLTSRAGQHSYAFNTLLVSVRLVRGSVHNTVASTRPLPDFTYTLEGNKGLVVLNPDDADIEEVSYAQRLTAGELSLELFDEALLSFKQLSEKYGFEPVIMYIPSAYTAYEPEVTFVDDSIHETMRSYSNMQRAYFAKQAEHLSIQYLDTTPTLQASASLYNTPEKLLYFPQNVHLTPYGHGIVAEALKPILVQEGA